MLGTCKLCRSYGELRESHFIPKGAYKAIQQSGGSPPVIVTPEVTIQKNEQMTAYILCPQCERRFAENGEDWVMKYCHRKGRGFRLRELIDASKPLRTDHSGLRVYSASDVPQIDVEKLTYFVSSIMWRGSVHAWKSGKDVRKGLFLGDRYEEELRTFLMGVTGFPENAALLVDIIPDADMWSLWNAPYLSSSRPFRQYSFPFLGMLFRFFLGNRIDPDIRRHCIFRSPERPILVSDGATEMVVRDFSKLMRRSRRVLVPRLCEKEEKSLDSL